MALAFGLGGRNVAASMLEEAYDRSRASNDRYRRDFAYGRERAPTARARDGAVDEPIATGRGATSTVDRDQ